MEEQTLDLHEFNIGGEAYIAGGQDGPSLLDLLKLEEALEKVEADKDGKARKKSPKNHRLPTSPESDPFTPKKTEKPRDLISPESKKAKLKKLFSEGSDHENQSFLVADNNGAKIAFKFFQSYFKDVPQKDRVYLQHKNRFIPQAKMITDTKAYDQWECHRRALIHAAKLHHPLARKYLAHNPFFLIEKDPNTRILPSQKEELEKVLRENCLEDIGRMALFTPDGNRHLFVFFLSYFDLPRNERHFLHEETDFIKLYLATEWKDRRHIEPWGKLCFNNVYNHHTPQTYAYFKLCKKACLLAKWLHHKEAKKYHENNPNFFSTEGNPEPDSKILRDLNEKFGLFRDRIKEAEQKKREFERKQKAEGGSNHKNDIESCQMTIVDLADKELKCLEEINKEKQRWREANPFAKEQPESLPCVNQFATLQTDLDVLTTEKEKHLRGLNIQAHRSILENMIHLKLTALKESDTFTKYIIPYFNRTQTVEHAQNRETSKTQVPAFRSTIDAITTYLFNYGEAIKAFKLGIETSKKLTRDELLAKYHLTEIDALDEIRTLLEEYKALLEEACKLLQEGEDLLQEAQACFDKGKEDYSADLGAKVTFYTRLKDAYLRYFEICGDEASEKDYQLASERTFKAFEDLEGTAQQKAIPDKAIFQKLKTQLITLSIKFEGKSVLALGDKPLKDNGHIKVAERYWQVLRGLTENHLILKATQIVAYHLERYLHYLENPNSPHNRGEEAAQHEFLAYGYGRVADLLLDDLSEKRCIYYKKAIAHLEKKIALLCTKGDWNKMRVLYMKLADAIDSSSSRQPENSEFCFHKAIACLESHVAQYPENDFGVTELASETYIAISRRLNPLHSSKISQYCRKSIEYLEKFMEDSVAKKSLEYLPRASRIVVEAIKMNKGEPLFVERCCSILATYVDTLIKQYEFFARLAGSKERVDPAIYKSAFETLDFAGNFLEHNPSLQLLYFVKQLNYLKRSFQNPENPTQDEKKRYFEMCFDFSSKVTNPEAMERLYDEGEQWVELYAPTQNGGSTRSTLSRSELYELFLNFSKRAKETDRTESVPEVSWDILIFACKAATLCSDITTRIEWCEEVHTTLNESLYLLGNAYWPTQEHYALIEQVRKTLEDLQSDSAGLLQLKRQQYQPLPNTTQITETLKSIPQLATLIPSTIDCDLASYLTKTTELLRDLSTKVIPVEDPKEEALLDALDSNPVHVMRSLLGSTRNEELRDHSLDFVDSHPLPDCGRGKRAECLDANDPIKKGVANHYIGEAKKLVEAAKAIPIRLERLNLLYRAADLYKESLKALNHMAKPKHYSKVYLTYSSIYDLISEEWNEFIESIRVSSKAVKDFNQDLRRELPNLKAVKSASEEAIGFVNSLLTCVTENDLLCGFPFIFRNLCEEPPELSGSLEELNKLFDYLQEKRATLSQGTTELVATTRGLIAQAFEHNCSIAIDSTIIDRALALAGMAANFHQKLKTDTPQLEGVISTAEKTQNYLSRLATTITDMVGTLSECPSPISRSCEGLPELTEEASKLDSIVADVVKRKQELMSNVLRNVSSESTYKDFVQRLQMAIKAAVVFQQSLAQYRSHYTQTDKKQILETTLSTTDMVITFLNRLLGTVSKRYFKRNIDSIFKLLEEDPPSLSEASDEFESLYDRLFDKATAVDACITTAIDRKGMYVAVGLDTKLAEAVDCASNSIYKAIDPEKAKRVAYEKAYQYQVLCIQRALPCEYIWDLFTDAIQYDFDALAFGYEKDSVPATDLLQGANRFLSESQRICPFGGKESVLIPGKERHVHLYIFYLYASSTYTQRWIETLGDNAGLNNYMAAAEAHLRAFNAIDIAGKIIRDGNPVYKYYSEKHSSNERYFLVENYENNLITIRRVQRALAEIKADFGRLAGIYLEASCEEAADVPTLYLLSEEARKMASRRFDRAKRYEAFAVARTKAKDCLLKAKECLDKNPQSVFLIPKDNIPVERNFYWICQYAASIYNLSSKCALSSKDAWDVRTEAFNLLEEVGVIVDTSFLSDIPEKLSEVTSSELLKFCLLMFQEDTYDPVLAITRPQTAANSVISTPFSSPSLSRRVGPSVIPTATKRGATPPVEQEVMQEGTFGRICSRHNSFSLKPGETLEDALTGAMSSFDPQGGPVTRSRSSTRDSTSLPPVQVPSVAKTRSRSGTNDSVSPPVFQEPDPAVKTRSRSSSNSGPSSVSSSHFPMFAGAVASCSSDYTATKSRSDSGEFFKQRLSDRSKPNILSHAEGSISTVSSVPAPSGRKRSNTISGAYPPTAQPSHQKAPPQSPALRRAKGDRSQSGRSSPVNDQTLGKEISSILNGPPPLPLPTDDAPPPPPLPAGTEQKEEQPKKKGSNLVPRLRGVPKGTSDEQRKGMRKSDTAALMPFKSPRVVSEGSSGMTFAQISSNNGLLRHSESAGNLSGLANLVEATNPRDLAQISPKSPTKGFTSKWGQDAPAIRKSEGDVPGSGINSDGRRSARLGRPSPLELEARRKSIAGSQPPTSVDPRAPSPRTGSPRKGSPRTGSPRTVSPRPEGSPRDKTIPGTPRRTSVKVVHNGSNNNGQ